MEKENMQAEFLVLGVEDEWKEVSKEELNSQQIVWELTQMVTVKKVIDEQ